MSQSIKQQNASLPISTEEMVNWLRDEKGVPEELGEAFLAAWVGILRSVALSRARRDQSFFADLCMGNGSLSLSAELVPEGSRDQDVYARISQQTGLPPSADQELLHAVEARLRLERAMDESAFVPVGHFRWRGAKKEEGFAVRCRKDFLAPILDEPVDLVRGMADLDDEAAERNGSVVEITLPFAASMPAHYYEMALDDARPLLGSNGAALESIKVRPIRYWPISSAEDFVNGYVYPTDYKEIDSFLSTHYTSRNRGTVSRGRADVYAQRKAPPFVFVEHDTGPEIIAPLDMAREPAFLKASIVPVIRATLRAVDRSNECRRAQGEKLSGRYYPAAAISLEERRQEAAGTILGVVPLPLPLEDSALDQLLNPILSAIK